MRVEIQQYLRSIGTLPTQRIICPECRNPQGFTISTGCLSETKYIRKDTQEEVLGFMFFCSEVCALNWPTPSQMGGVQ